MLEVRYAVSRRPAISLWECQAAAAYLRKLGAAAIRESQLFQAIERQREIVRKAAAKKRAARSKLARQPQVAAPPPGPTPEPADGAPDADQSDSGDEYPGEIWP